MFDHFDKASDRLVPCTISSRSAVTIWSSAGFVFRFESVCSALPSVMPEASRSLSSRVSSRISRRFMRGARDERRSKWNSFFFSFGEAAAGAAMPPSDTLTGT